MAELVVVNNYVYWSNFANQHLPSTFTDGMQIEKLLDFAIFPRYLLCLQIIMGKWKIGKQGSQPSTQTNISENWLQSRRCAAPAIKVPMKLSNNIFFYVLFSFSVTKLTETDLLKQAPGLAKNLSFNIFVVDGDERIIWSCETFVLRFGDAANNKHVHFHFLNLNQHFTFSFKPTLSLSHI